MRRQLAEAGRSFAEAEPPAPLEPGYVVAWAAAAWVVALTADAAAFRARATFESIVPAGSLFVFASALGAARYRLPATAAFLSAALLAWLTQRVLGRAGTSRWVGVDRGQGLRAIAGSGAWLGVVAVLAASLVAPHLPGARDDPIIPWDDRNGDEPSRITVSPLVDIRTRLVEQSEAEVFTVTSTVRSYWRLTALDQFDGQIWSSNNRYTAIDGPLRPPSEATPTQVLRADQRFTIAGLESAWLPAAYRAVAEDGIDARYHAGSGTLLADEPTEQDQTYRVVSLVPVLTEGELASVGWDAPRALVAANTALPEDFSPRVDDLAEQIAGDARTPYVAARRLQDHFRSGIYTYDLGVGRGESQRALERFLFDTRRGYCEQFAGAFAAMARSLGIPARVAVGFTPGEEIADDTYLVRGLHGHAWPEVYLEGYGWVAFEPTPGRGMPNGQDYTGVAPEQATSVDTTPTTIQDTTTTTLGTEVPDTLPEDVPASGGGGAVDDERFIDRALPFLVAAPFLPLVWLLGMTVARQLVRRRRRHGADGPAQLVLVAWREAIGALDRAGLPRRPSETPAEYARRAGESGLTAPDGITELARAATAAVYGGRTMADTAAARAVELADGIAGEVDDAIGRRRRMKIRFDPRSLRDPRSEGSSPVFMGPSNRRELKPTAPAI
ncbi:MAG: DUF3488 and DUF4129 domain-containing transglutaminase family protein [Acidimicrobiia bacterium]